MAASPSAAAGEYAREAEVELVPSLFFAQHLRATWGVGEAMSLVPVAQEWHGACPAL